MTNLIAKISSSVITHSDDSDTRKNSPCPLWTKSLANAIATMVFRESDAILAISFEFLLCLAIP